MPIEPALSSSTPVPASAPSVTNRPRRHTITRSDPTLNYIMPNDIPHEQEDEDKRLDRISCILSSLLQEANEAIQTNSSTLSPRRSSLRNKSRSRLPRLKKHFSIVHVRNESISSSSSTSSASPIFPPSPPSTVSSSSRSPSPTLFKKKVFRPVSRPASWPVQHPRRRSSMTPHITRSSCYTQVTQSPTLLHDPLHESFRRLDTSMALVDSLSRDLAISKSPPATSSECTRLSVLLLFPLLHIPHVLMTMVFSVLNIHPVTEDTPSSSLVGVFVWTCFVAMATLRSEERLVPTQWASSKAVRRLSLPGSYRSLPAPVDTLKSTSLQPSPASKAQVQLRPQLIRRTSV